MATTDAASRRLVGGKIWWNTKNIWGLMCVVAIRMTVL